jgi:hypothetical protein
MVPIGYLQKKLYVFFTVIDNKWSVGTHWVSQPCTHQGVCVWDFGLICSVTNALDMNQSRGLGPHGHKHTPLE